eukprot:s2637_g1.t1
MPCRRSLRNAFRIALSEVEADLEGGDSGFRLFSNGDVLLQVPEVAHPDLSPKAYENLPGPVEDFVGREETSRGRVVVLHCPRKLGLTATLTMIARYISAPGRKFSGSCIFGEAQPLKKGLLIMDDADSALLEHAEVLKQNLESDKFYLLAGCSKPQWELFSDVVKAVHVELPPLSLLESATLFLQRCHRPLTLEDVLHPNSTDERVVKKEPLPKERAKQLLKPMASVFEGDPRLIRQAAGKVTPNRQPLHGDLQSLKAECIGALEPKKTYLHEQKPCILHRDLKSSNVLLTKPLRNSSQEPFAKVADFGLSRVDAAETSKQGLTVGVGTWRWMAPEVFASSDDDPEPYNLKADVFSFGILMYEVMERQLPYSERFGSDVSDPRISLHVCMGLRPEVRSSTSEDSPEVREAIRNLMQRAWHNEPDDRPSFPERHSLLFWELEEVLKGQWEALGGARGLEAR